MANNNSDMNSHSPIMDDNISMSVYDALPDIAYNGSHSDRAIPHDFEQSQQSINEAIDLTSSNPITNFEFLHTYPNPNSFVEEGLLDDEWSQYFAPTTGHVQDLQDEGVMQSIEGVDGNITSILNTVHHNSPPQPSPPAPLHTTNSLGSQTVQVLGLSSIDPNSMPSSATQATASRTPSPPDNKGRGPNTRGTRYNCTDCGISSKTKRDHKRHLMTKKHRKNASGENESVPAATGVYCPVEDCKFHRSTGNMLSFREDNLWRHIKTVHDMDIKGKCPRGEE